MSCEAQNSNVMSTAGKDQVPPAGKDPDPSATFGNAAPFSYYMPKINELILKSDNFSNISEVRMKH